MKAIILNAGKGQRLAPYTDHTHKCLIEVGGRAILAHQLEALAKSAVNDVVLVVGYLKDKIVEYVAGRYPGMNFTFIENRDFRTTNTAYSLHLASNEMDDDFLYLNGDVLTGGELIDRLVRCDHPNALAVEKKECGEEEVKVVVDKGRIISIGKHVSIADAYGEFIGIAKFSRQMTIDFVRALFQVVDEANGSTAYFEDALQRIVESTTLHCVDVSDLPCIEIDFPADLERAELETIPLLRKESITI